MLTLLSTLRKTAIAWGVIGSMPKILKLKKQPQRFADHEDEAYDRLRAAARGRQKVSGSGKRTSTPGSMNLTGAK